MSDLVSGVGDHRICPYDAAWAWRAQDLVVMLQGVLGLNAVGIEHIGSTSVPGLASRPIPDIQVAVSDITDTPTFYPLLVTAGYRHFAFPELPVDDYYVFVPSDGSNTEHIQVCEAGSLQERRHLAVRDYLRAHMAECLAYENVKRNAAEAARGRREAYSAAKDTFLQELESRALTWQAGDRRS